MPLQREFLGFQRPALLEAADWLLEHSRDNQSGDLSDWLVVVPSRSAARRLLEMLLEEARSRGVPLLPPEIETIGQLPEHLYTPKLPFASPLVQQLAWTSALRESRPELLAKIIARRPEEEDDAAWRSLGELLRRQHTELAAEGVDFSHVANLLEGMGDEEEAADESDRWRALRRVQQTYLHTLDDLLLWDKQTARLYAIEKREFATDRRLALFGMTELSRAMRQMLDQVSEQTTALIFAPAEWADRFDDYGCVNAAYWQEAMIDLDDRRVILADMPADQARAVAAVLAESGGRRRADEITIGMPDPGLASQVQRQLEECGIATRWFEGKRLSDTGPCRFLSALATYLERGRFSAFAALVRHPDVFAWMRRHACVETHAEADLLALLDQFYMDHLPPHLDGELPQGNGRVDYAALGEAIQCLEKLLAPLRGPDRRLVAWIEPLAKVLLDVYGERDYNREDERDGVLLAACERLRDALVEHRGLPPRLSPVLSAAGAIRITLEQLAGEQVPPRREPHAVEMQGWLDLPWDDAPVLAITTFNEGYVPNNVGADMFMPDSLRRRLGLTDNDRRYARDAYALSAILHSREEVTLIVGRRDADGGPLAPSRLLFAADSQTIARRALRLFAPPAAERRPTSRRRQAIASQFEIPRPLPLPQPITALSVTSFRAYLSCPYRFYLQHALQLKTLHDRPREMEPRQFGDLLHWVLDEFGRDTDINRSTNPERIEAFLSHHLDRHVERWFGKRRLAAIDVQVEQARQRLRGFSFWQARHARAGWRIIHAEAKEYSRTPTLVVDGQPFELKGRIDRIDIHDDHGVLVGDYKSADSGKSPEDAHRKGNKWIDLQLPLYRHLARLLDGVQGQIHLGYIVLPRDVSKTELVQAPWDERELADADETAHQVIRCVRKEIFWPPSPDLPTIGQEFGSICQDRLFGKKCYGGENEEA